LRAVQCTV